MIDALALIESRLNLTESRVRRAGNKLTARCPAHPDREPSLSVAYGSRGRDIVIHCHAGCKADDVLAALDLKWTDFGESNPREHPIDYWVYKSAEGRPLYRVAKYPGKKFRQHAYLPSGEWDHTLGNVERVPYRLPELIAAIDRGDTVWVAEGEKDCDALVAHDVTATCNAGGAGSFTARIAKWLKGAQQVVIVADRDKAGIEHANDVAGHCTVLNVPYRIVQAVEGKDAYDHFAFGHTVDEFVDLDAADNDPTAETWPEPRPLETLIEAPEFPVDVFPDWIADQIEAASSEMQCPPDLPAQLAITALSICAGGRVKVHVHSAWYEQTNTYLVTGLNPGENKSPNVKLMMRPIEEWEIELAERSAHERGQIETKQKILTKQYNRAVDKGEMAEALAINDDLAALPPTNEPRLMADDITPEQLEVLLQEQGGRLAIVSTEGGVFGQMTGRYSDKPNMNVFLMGWSGDTIRVDRVGRESRVIHNPALTIGVTVQPDVIARLSETPELRGRGLTARFMYSVPRSLVGYRDMSRRTAIDEMVLERYGKHLRRLAEDLHLVRGAVLELGGGALLAFTEFRQDLERRRQPGGDIRHMTEWTIKLESTVVRLAGLLHLADGERLDDPVSASTMRRAIQVGRYWEAHARIAHVLWMPDPVLKVADTILRWAIDNQRSEVTVREAYSINRRITPSKADVVEPLELLVERGWLRPLDGAVDNADRRGKASQTFQVHPQAHVIVGAQNATEREKGARMRAMRLETYSDEFSLSSSESVNGAPCAHSAHARNSEPVDNSTVDAEQAPVEPTPYVNSPEDFF